jgi:tripartite ATP-independent transporter DctP family solute receptor
MMMKKLIILLCVMFINNIVLADTCFAASKTLNIGHGVSTEDPYHKGVQKFADLVTERTDGRYTFEIFPNCVLGSEREMVEGTQLGTLDFALATNAVYSTMVPEIGCLDFPYLFSSREETYAILDSEIGTKLLGLLDNVGIKGLAMMENGFRCLNSKVFIDTVEGMRGVKMRTMETPVHVASFEALGCVVAAVSGNELFTALQQGVVDAEENPLKAIYDQKYYEIAPYILKTEHFYSTANLGMSKRLFDSLTTEDQQIFIQAVKEATAYQRQCSIEREAEVTTKMKELNVTITEMNPEEKKIWRDAMSNVYKRSEFVEKYGKWLNEIADKRAALGF